MHESMARLYDFVKDKHGLSGQSLLARKMEETPQVVKNWESRGISESGALAAQLLFGCDANWLRGNAAQAQWPPHTGDSNVIGLTASQAAGGWMWPFKTIGPNAYRLLSDEEKDHIEKSIGLLVKNRGDPSNQVGPVYKIAESR